MTQIIGILSGLGAMFGWGIADFFAAKSSKETSPLQTVFLSQLFGLLIVTSIFLLAFRDFATPWRSVGEMAALQLIFTLALFSFYRSLEIGPVSITSPISSAYPLITIFITVGFLGETLFAKQWLAISLILLGILLASIQFEKLSIRLSSRQGILFAFLAMVLWGVSIAFLGRVVDEIGWFKVTLLGSVFAVMWLAILFGLQGGFKKLWGSGPNKNIAAITIFQLFGTAVFYFGLERELTAVVTPVSSTYPLITVLLALTVLKERVLKSQLFGVGLIIFGLVLLTIK